jgi:hypothetical protein
MIVEDTFPRVLKLCKHNYWEAIRPILDANSSKSKQAAAIMGDGSEVLGFDLRLSTDHMESFDAGLAAEPPAIGCLFPFLRLRFDRNQP